MNKRIECLVSGRVQMVMYRDFSQRKGTDLGLKGTVQNIKGGKVIVIAEGDVDKLKVFLELLHKGPIFAKVVDIDVKWSDARNEFKGFSIVYRNLLDRI